MKKRYAFLACTGLLIACGGSAPDLEPGPKSSGSTRPSEPQTGSAGTGTLHDPNSYVPPMYTNMAVVELERITFPAEACSDMKGRPVGSIILGDRAAEGTGVYNPDGFLRKIKSVTCNNANAATPGSSGASGAGSSGSSGAGSSGSSGAAGGTVVETDPATLEEAFDDLKLDAGFSIPACNEANGGSGGKNLGVSYGGNLFEEKSTAQTSDGQTVPFTASAALDSAICLSPKFNVKADVGFLEVRSFEASVVGELDARLLLTTSITVDSTDPKVLADLANKPLTKSYAKVLASGKIPITTLKIGFIGLPVTASYETTLTCDFDFTAPVEAKVGATAKGTLTAGLRYQNSQLSPVFDKNVAFNAVPPQFTKDGMLRARCTVTPKIELSMFGVLTGKLTPRVYAGIGATQTCGAKDAQGVTQRQNTGDVEGGASASVYGEVNLFGIKKFKKECTLFDERVSLQYSRTYAQPGGANATCTPPEALPTPRPLPVNPQACFGDNAPPPETKTPIAGTCTHDVCTAGVKLGQQCDDCTMKVCDKDPYCCDTYWGQSCFESVRQYCGRVCPTP